MKETIEVPVEILAELFRVVDKLKSRLEANTSPLPSPEEQSKRCTRCDVTKPLKEFSKRGNGHQSKCKMCSSRINKELYARYDERILSVSDVSEERQTEEGNIFERMKQIFDEATPAKEQAVVEHQAETETVRTSVNPNFAKLLQLKRHAPTQ